MEELKKLSTIKNKISPVTEIAEIRRIKAEVIKLDANLRVCGIGYLSEFLVTSEEEYDTKWLEEQPAVIIPEKKQSIAKAIKESVK